MGWFSGKDETDGNMRKNKEGPYMLPPEDNGNPKSVYVENAGSKYRIATLPDFIRLRNECNSDDGWTERYRQPNIIVYERPAPEGAIGGSLNQVKVVNYFEKTRAETLYNALHDPDFRKTWDNNMIEGFNICQLDPRNDIGYYSAAFPWPLTNREFINLRCWMEFTNGEFIIANRSVVHNDYPCTAKYVRGLSYFTGYYISPLKGTDPRSEGCRMIYYTHSDPSGSIPHSLMNMAYTKMVPSLMAKLEENSTKYSEWCKSINRNPDFVGPWRTASVAWDGTKNDTAAHAVNKIVSGANANAMGEPAASIDLCCSPGTSMADVTAMKNVQSLDQISDNTPPSPSTKPAVPSLVSQGHTLPPDETSMSEASKAASLSNPQVQKLQEQLDEFKKKIRSLEQEQLLSGEGTSLAPAGSARREEDPDSIQQFRAMLADALNFLDRQYIHQGRAPASVTEYMMKLQIVCDGVRRSLLEQQQQEEEQMQEAIAVVA